MFILRNLSLLKELIYFKLKKTPLFGPEEWSNRAPELALKGFSTLNLPHRQILLRTLEKLFTKDLIFEVLDVGGGWELTSSIVLKNIGIPTSRS